MDIVLLASNKPGIGKTAVAAAIVSQWSRQGHPTAYLRIGPDGGNQEADTNYLADLASTNQPHPPVISVPRINPQGATIGGLNTALADLSAEVSSLGCRLVVEVSLPATEESRTWALCGELAEAAKASVVAMVDYAATIDTDRLNAELRPVRQRLGGLLVNATPPYRVRESESRLLQTADGASSQLLGVIPEDRMMLAPTVGQLASHLGAQWVLGEERADDFVYRVLIGGNLMDPGVTYFGRHQDQAVVVRGNRPDIQLAALSSEMRCLILTGGHQPIPYVLHEAQQQGVPLLVVETDTHATAEMLGGLVSWGTVYDRRKSKHYAHLLEQHCEVALLQGLLG